MARTRAGVLQETMIFPRWRSACVNLMPPRSGKESLEGSLYFSDSGSYNCGKYENQSLKFLIVKKGPAFGYD